MRSRLIKKFSPWQVVALIAAACVALVFWWAFRPPPMERVASVDLLYKKFAEAVFESDYATNPSRTKISLWHHNMRFFLVPPYPSFLDAPLRRYLLQLSRLSGIDGRAVTDRKSANVLIHVVPRQDFVSVRKQYSHLAWVAAKTGPVPDCFVHEQGSHGVISGVLIGINNERSDIYVQSCLLEELYQGIGPGKNTSIIRPSISSAEDNELTELSLNDKILLRAMYDPSIKPGMAREEVLRRIRPILERLTAAVKRDGEQALDHPAWVARQRKIP